MSQQLNQILSLVQTDFNRLDDLIAHGIHSKVPLVLMVSQHVVQAGGKRMRPLMSLLAFHACGGDVLNTELDIDNAVKYAAIIEMLHTATLVHDDVVDESNLRRGRPTANATWNNPTAVLVGDFLIARAFDLLVKMGDLDLLNAFSVGTCDIAEGEVLQLQHQHNPDSTENDYLQIIYGKTSRLFMLATEGAAILQHRDNYRQAMRNYAAHFGNAFQIVDDVLDYSSDSETLGKNVGDDLMEGKPTLPLIAAMKMATPEDAVLIRLCVQTGGTEKLQEVIRIIQNSGALDYCKQRALEETQLAVDALKDLPESQYKTALADLALLAAERVK